MAKNVLNFDIKNELAKIHGFTVNINRVAGQKFQISDFHFMKTFNLSNNLAKVLYLNMLECG
jgi:hypothetical protein